MLNKETGLGANAIFSLRDSVIVSAMIEGPAPVKEGYKLSTWELHLPYLSCNGGYTVSISRKEFHHCNRLIREINRHGLPKSMSR